MEKYIGEIRAFAGNYAPEGWAICDGSLLLVKDNTALFSTIGVKFGGDGINNFALPDLRGRLLVGQGTGPGLTPRILGQSFGTETVKLAIGNIPDHTHTFYISHALATESLPKNDSYLGHLVTKIGTSPVGYISESVNPKPVPKPLNSSAVANSISEDTAHANIMPVLAINYIISLSGVYPVKSS